MGSIFSKETKSVNGDSGPGIGSSSSPGSSSGVGVNIIKDPYRPNQDSKDSTVKQDPIPIAKELEYNAKECALLVKQNRIIEQERLRKKS